MRRAKACSQALFLHALPASACETCLGVERAHMFRRQRQKRKMPRAFDGESEFALMARTGANFATRANLAAIRQVAAQLFRVLVIDKFIFVFAVDTDPAHRWTKTALLPVP